METTNETINKSKFLEILNSLFAVLMGYNMLYKGDHWFSFIKEHLEYAVNELDDNQEVDWESLRENITDEIWNTTDTFLTYYSDQEKALVHFGIDQVQQEMNDMGDQSIQSGIFMLVYNEGMELFNTVMNLLEFKIDNYMDWSCDTKNCDSIFVTQMTSSYSEYYGSKKWTDVNDVCYICNRRA